MTATQSLKIYEIRERYFNNDADAQIVAEEIEQVVLNKFVQEKENIATKPEVMLLRKDIKIFRREVKTGFAESESRMKSETSELIVWIIAPVLTSGALFITLAKVFFDK